MTPTARGDSSGADQGMQAVVESAMVLETLEAATKDDAIDEILAAVVAAGRLTKARATKIRKKIAEREELGSTGIGNGVAVPHVKVEGVTETLMVLGRSVTGIDYDSVDGRPVHTVFFLVAPKDAAESHLRLLRWISGLARNPDFRRFVQSARSEADIRALLRQMMRDR